MNKFLILAMSTVLVWMFSIRLQLGLTRYFDVDEYAYLHWAYHVFSGNVPYRDFFFYIPPGFLWVFAPLFAFFHGSAPFIAGRVVAFGVFIALCAVVSFLFLEVRGDKGDKGNMGKNWTVLVPALLLIFLPLPSDKFLEIRPDTLAMLLAMVGLLFQIRGIRDIGEIRGKKIVVWFFSGVFYGLSLLVLPKTLPQVAVAVLVAVGWVVWGKGKRVLPFFVGLFVPLGLFGLWVISLGIMDVLWYSIATLPREVGQETAKLFPMQPDLFFYPNGTYYGENGWAVGLIVNHAIWIIGLAMGAVRLLTPWLGREGREGLERQEGKNNTKAWSEFLIAGSFFSHVLFFFWIYPLRHAQYLIPIAVFVAWYAADGIQSFWQKVRMSNTVAVAFLFVFLFGLSSIGWVFLRVNQPKLAWNNKAPLAAVDTLYAAIPFTEYLLDLDGRTLYYKDPSYICCLPYGEFAGFVSRKLPALIPLLEQTGTRYIYEGELLRVNTLPASEKQYIRSHYAPHPDIPGLLRARP